MRLVPRQKRCSGGGRGAQLGGCGAVLVVGVSGQSPEGVVALGYILRGIGNSQVPKDSCMP